MKKNELVLQGSLTEGGASDKGRKVATNLKCHMQFIGSGGRVLEETVANSEFFRCSFF